MMCTMASLQKRYTLPILISERKLSDTFPLPYNVEATPYAKIRDFSRAARYELIDMQRRFNLPPAKIIFLGDVSVGKTTLVSRFCYDLFRSNYKATIGVDFEIETFNILGQNFTLEMWDTAAQERFKCIAQSYYRNANAIVVMFDMSKLETLSNVKKWIDSALAVNISEKPLIFLVGTKSDLLTKEEFLHAENLATEIAYEIRAEYWSVSARTGFKVVKLFRRIAALTFCITFKEFMAHREQQQQRTISLSNQVKEKSSIFGFRKRDIMKSFCLC